MTPSDPAQDPAPEEPSDDAPAAPIPPLRGLPPPAVQQPLPPGGSVVDALTGRDLYHGNYCGRGSRGPGLPPVDRLDAACAAHDLCYETAGYRSCACDTTLKAAALALSNDGALPRDIRARAGTIAQAAELMECRRP